jgi:endopeptidase Clp ATP-binding regulatory subunit ClpX
VTVSTHLHSAEAPEESEEEAAGDSTFAFNRLPKDITAHLDRFVIQQDEAKKVLAIAICDHYNQVNLVRRLKGEGMEHSIKEMEYAKQNVILIGPTGVGKTYLIKHAADLIGVPFVKADATKFSETGYVGGDVEDLVRDLVRVADGNVELAQYGIIYLDEVDKIASSQHSSGRDVSGRGVQTALLKLMEETEVPVRNPFDIQSQLQAAFEFQRHGGKPRRETINTRHILFIVSGAFEKLKDSVAHRVNATSIGFSATQPPLVMDNELFKLVSTKDFIQFGFEPEFIGRLPVRVVCEELRVDDLFEILKRSEGSIIRQYERAFRAYGIEVNFEDAALHKIASLAAEEKTGARGLLTVCERILRDFKYELPGSGVRMFTVNEPLIDSPAAVLRQLMKEGQQEKEKALAAVAIEFARRASERYGVTIEFEPESVSALVQKAKGENLHMRDLCETLFKDYEFGLKLVRDKIQGEVLRIPPEAVDDPDSFLSEWLVKRYREP